MTAYSEVELKYARPVASAILESERFRLWLLAGTKHENDALGARPVGEIQGTLRSRTIKNPLWFNYWCGRDSKCACRIGTGIESDILLILDCANGRRLGLHIEIKRPGEQLGEGQAESYQRRAACWASPVTRPKTVWPHEDYLTFLICGPELASDKLSFFDKVLFHNEVKQMIKVYPEVDPSKI
jgi:hypothetical protein